MTTTFIAPDNEFDGAPLLRTEVTLDSGHGGVRRSTLRLSALGVCEAWINGEPVSPDVLTPGWSSFEWRRRYAEHNVTHLVSGDAIVIGIALGNGWYRGRLGWTGRSGFYGSELAGYAHLTVEFDDGQTQIVQTGDAGWRAAPSSTTANDLYDGQTIDARRSTDGWTLPGFDTTDWVGVHPADAGAAALEPYIGPPVRRQEHIAPERIWTSPSGRVLVDFGQNLVGWVRVKVRGERDTTITVRHAEVLENDELGVRPLRSARATDRFILSGGDDDFEPTLTFHGFRFIEIDGWPGGIDGITEGALAAVVVSSELQRTGTFRSSDPLLNKLHDNVVWGMRGNFLDVPTDCPQRDERLGWTGDIAAFAPTAAYLYDAKNFLRDWLRNVALEQHHQGGVVPAVVPDILKGGQMPEEFQPVESTAVWSDAAVWVPWSLWWAYGDTTVLAEQYESMTSHVRHVRGLLSPEGLWNAGFQFGDWLDPDAPPERPAAAKADPGVVATICAYRSTSMLATIARELGNLDDAAEFDDLAAHIRAGFQSTYVSGERIESDCTTVYTLAITFEIVDDDQLGWAGERLAELVKQSGYRISTGFAGTPFICDALTTTGHVDVAYRLLLQRESPSWLYPVTMGATTIWERWDSMLPDGSINPGEMTSFNHYALGAVADWMHRTIGGLAPLNPGYSRILVSPQPGGGLAWAESSLATPHGLASVRWERTGDHVSASVTVPPGSTALVRVAGVDEHELSPGTHELTFAAAVA